MKVKTLEELVNEGALEGKRVFIRADMNVPRDAEGNVTDDHRLKESMPAVKMALKGGAGVMVCSHLGRPKEGELTEQDSLAKVAETFGKMLGMPIRFEKDWLNGVDVKPGEVVILENSITSFIVSISSYITILMFEPHSIYSMRLAQKGELLTHHKDRAVLTLLRADSVIEKDFQMVSPEMTLGDMVKVISRSGRNTFPVVDERGVLLGIVLLDNIRNIMFRPELYNRFHVSKFMVSAPAKIVINTPMDQIMQTFDDTKAWNLPVDDENGHYIGFMSKSKIFNSYREVLVDNFSGD